VARLRKLKRCGGEGISCSCPVRATSEGCDSVNYRSFEKNLEILFVVALDNYRK
jgi:hypothetical protein